MTSPAGATPNSRGSAGQPSAATTAEAFVPADAGAPAPRLLLFTRRGCCLCEGLEERLRALPRPPALELRDVDADPHLLERYDLRVPVLALPLAAAAAGMQGWRELPAVPPRLAGARLEAWLMAHGAVGGAAGGAAPGPSGRP